jgi:hypothetical protein
MTREEERIYLTNLLIDATAWQISEGETRSGIELECIDRLRKLNNMPSIDVVGKPSDEVLNEDDYKALEAARLNEYLSNRSKSKRKWAKNRVRVVIDGKPTWKLRSECHKEVMPGWTTKLHWVWDGPAGDEETAVDKLGDELWNEHEKGE